MVRRTARRWPQRLGLLASTGVLCVAALLFLVPPDALVWPGRVVGTVYRDDAAVGTVALVRRAGRWEGDAGDFPPGTATHFAPDTYHGFFVVRLADGRLLALADRGAHRGQLVSWHGPIRAYGGGAQPPGFVETRGGGYYAPDGANLSGPAPRPLDPFPLTVEGERVIIASAAECPPGAPSFQLWCHGPRP